MKIDIHVHAVGRGHGDTGCWYQPRGWARIGQPFMLRSFGLPASALCHEFDSRYVTRLVSLIRDSSLDAVVLLAQDHPYHPNGTRIDGVASHFVPNRYVLKLADTHPEILAGVSIHPARPDALDELEFCLEHGAALLKCLPNCQNIDWNDHRYTRFLERMAEAGLPLLAHTGGEHTLPVIDESLADPAVLTRPLEIGVTCIAAHCATASGLFDRDYFDDFVRLLERYPNLYGDNSAFNVPNRRLGRRHLDRCLSDALAGRILYGSDAPVPVSGHAQYLRGHLSRRALMMSIRERNLLERDFQLKRAMGFPEASFTRAAEILRLRPSPQALSL